MTPSIFPNKRPGQGSPIPALLPEHLLGSRAKAGHQTLGTGSLWRADFIANAAEAAQMRPGVVLRVAAFPLCSDPKAPAGGGRDTRLLFMVVQAVVGLASLRGKARGQSPEELE